MLYLVCSCSKSKLCFQNLYGIKVLMVPANGLSLNTLTSLQTLLLSFLFGFVVVSLNNLESKSSKTILLHASLIVVSYSSCRRKCLPARRVLNLKRKVPPPFLLAARNQLSHHKTVLSSPNTPNKGWLLKSCMIRKHLVNVCIIAGTGLCWQLVVKCCCDCAFLQ